jgi:hypothetical protein
VSAAGEAEGRGKVRSVGAAQASEPGTRAIAMQQGQPEEGE